MSQLRSALSNLMPISLWERTIFVKCIPIPANFTERRAVLRALQKETSEGIEVFKKMKVGKPMHVGVSVCVSEWWGRSNRDGNDDQNEGGAFN